MKITLWMCLVCQTVKVVQFPDKLGGQIYCVPCHAPRKAREIVNDTDTDFFLKGE